MYFNKSNSHYLPLSDKIKEEDMTDGTSWHSNLHSWYYRLPAIPKELPAFVFQSLFGKKSRMPPIVSYGCGAQFIVSKKCILKHPVSFYKTIVDMLSTENNPVEGFIIERLHGWIFK